MRVLLIGAGGREHALAEAILQSPTLNQLFWLPGNAALAGKVVKVGDIDPCDGPRIATYAQRQGIDLAVIGPEAPLLAGVADCLTEGGIPCFGPSKAGARLEGSKTFAKDLMHQAGVPTARYTAVADAAEAVKTVEKWGAPMVIKADGLAAGKGVTVAMTMAEALQAAHSLEGPAVIEEYLEGQELSFMVLAQGENYIPLVPSRDYKRVGEGDTGPNTGGMGAVAGFHLIGSSLQQQIGTLIISPVLKAMASQGRPFRGLLYAGLMLTKTGPKVLEFNVRFGDPEAQAMLPLWEDDLLEVFATVAGGSLPRHLTWSGEKGMCLVLASGGYPGSYQTGYAIRNIAAVPESVRVYQAGTALRDGQIVTAGGRVLTLAATGPNLPQVRQKIYQAAQTIDFPNKYYRGDIGAD